MARGKRKKRETIREMQPDEAALRIMEWTDPDLEQRPEEPDRPAASDDEPGSERPASA
jgi:hypothetical protein